MLRWKSWPHLRLLTPRRRHKSRASRVKTWTWVTAVAEIECLGRDLGICSSKNRGFGAAATWTGAEAASDIKGHAKQAGGAVRPWMWTSVRCWFFFARWSWAQAAIGKFLLAEDNLWFVLQLDERCWSAAEREDEQMVCSRELPRGWQMSELLHIWPLPLFCSKRHWKN
jgi:hypothetical protein